MVKCLKGFLAGVFVTLLVVAWFAHSRMVVRTSDGYRVVSKISGDFQRFYVDVHNWGILDYTRNRDVTEALARDGWGHAKDALQDAAGKAEQSLQEAEARLKEKLAGH